MPQKANVYAKWLRDLANACLPIELQKKLVTLQPLTRDEALKYAHVLQLVAQAKSLTKQTRDQSEILAHQAEVLPKITATSTACDRLLEMITRMENRQLEQGKTLHTIDIHTTPPLIRLEDLFKGNTDVQRKMFIAGFRLLKSKQYDKPRTAATVVFDEFKRNGISGRYENRESFCVMFARKWELFCKLPRL